jgi:apolipoprotein N-acyltransferase
MKWRYFLTWLPGIPIAILNASIRTYVYSKYFNELQAHQLSVLSFVILFGLYVWLVFPRLRLKSQKESFKVGAFWIALTILFEFVFGHYAMGHSWSVLFHDYNIFSGRLWLLVLIWIFLAPYLTFQLRKKTFIKSGSIT